MVLVHLACSGIRLICIRVICIYPRTEHIDACNVPLMEACESTYGHAENRTHGRLRADSHLDAPKTESAHAQAATHIHAHLMHTCAQKDVQISTYIHTYIHTHTLHDESL
jgi:hypothetical protein